MQGISLCIAPKVFWTLCQQKASPPYGQESHPPYHLLVITRDVHTVGAFSVLVAQMSAPSSPVKFFKCSLFY